MKILCPVNAAGDIDVLADNGADEFYFGFQSPRLVELSRAHLFWNRRPYPSANVPVDSGLPFEMLRAARERNRPLYVLANELFYSEAQAKELKKHISKLSEEGLNGLVVSNLSLITWFSRHFPDLKIIASTTANVFNSGSAEFFRDLGISRIIIPIRAFPDEIAKIHSAVPGMELECFTIMEGCINVNGLCLFCHLNEISPTGKEPCRIPVEETGITGASAETVSVMMRNLEIWSEKNFFLSDCAVCSLPELSEAGVGYLKMSGREMALGDRLKYLHFLRGAADASEMLKANKARGNSAIKTCRKAIRLMNMKYINTCTSNCFLYTSE